jgi:EamA domain-containing membrane protein RarD
MAEQAYKRFTRAINLSEALRSPENALDCATTYVAYGRVAKAIDLLKAAAVKFPASAAIKKALESALQLDQESLATSNGPPLLLAIIGLVGLMWGANFALEGVIKAPWHIKPFAGVTLALSLFGCYACIRHAVLRWRQRK